MVLYINNSEPSYGDIVIIDSRVNRNRTINDDVFDSLKNNLVTSRIFGKETEEILWIKRVIGKYFFKL